MARYSLFVLKVPLNTNQTTIILSVPTTEHTRAQPMLTNPRDAFRGQSRSSNMVRYGFLLVCYSNFVPNIPTSNNFVTLKSGSEPQRSLKVVGTDKDRSAAFDFLLTSHSNHEPISYRFRDKRRFQSTGLAEGQKSSKIGLAV